MPSATHLDLSRRRAYALAQETTPPASGARLGVLAKLGTLSILYLAVFLTRIGFGTILVIFPIYVATPSSSLAAIIIALYPALEGFSALPVGAVVDLRGRRRVFVTGMALISVLTF